VGPPSRGGPRAGVLRDAGTIEGPFTTAAEGPVDWTKLASQFTRRDGDDS